LLTQSIARALLASLLMAWPALAESPAEAREAPAPIATAPVELDGVALFHVRGTSSFPAAKRAGVIALRIAKAARDPAVAPDSIHIVELELSSRIDAGEQLLIEVFDLDGALEDIDRRVLARGLVSRISDAIAEYRRERTRAVLVSKTAALIGTALAGSAAVLVLLWLIRRLDAALERRLRSRLHDVAVKGLPIIRAEQLWAATAAVLRGLRTYSQILQTSVINYSSLARQRKLILYTQVGIGYETPWRQVEAMLLAAAARTQGVLREPAPFVLLKSLGDFAVTYELNVYTDDPRTMARQYAEIHRNVLDVFNEHAVQIMTPAYESDPAQPKIVPKEHWFTAPASAPRE